MKTPIRVKTFVCLSVSAALLMCCSVSRADITGYNLAADGDGVMTCSTYGFTTNGIGDYSLVVHAHHNTFAAGDLVGNVITDTQTDPSLTLNHIINNDTDFIWTDYHLKITMDKSFSLSGVTVANPGWTSVATAPTLVGSDWIGYIDYYSGSPVPIGQILSFGYTMSFIGSVSFSEELTPTTSVPEPASAAFLLLGMGALVCSWRLKKGKAGLTIRINHLICVLQTAG